MNIYIDENFATQIARALSILQEPRIEENIHVYNISDVFGKDAQDEIWITKVAEEEGVVITQDLNIKRTKQQRKLFKEYCLGIIFLKPPI